MKLVDHPASFARLACLLEHRHLALQAMRELLGDMLMELKRPNEAIAEYRATLRKEPNRRHALHRVEGMKSSD